MKKTLQILALLCVSVVFSQVPTEKIKAFLKKNKLELAPDDISNWRVQSSTTSKSMGVEIFYLVQSVNGIDIKNAYSNVVYKNGKVISGSNNFIKDAKSKINTAQAKLNISDAFLGALDKLGEKRTTFQIIEQKENNKYKLANGSSDNLVNASLQYYPVNNNTELKMAWSFEFYTQDYNHLWNLMVDANTGEILEKFDAITSCSFEDDNHKEHNHGFFFAPKLFKQEEKKAMTKVQSGSYRVIPFEIESPNHGAFQLISNPSNAVASPFGWHDTNGADGAEYTITRGNNVYALDDRAGDNGINGISPDGGPTLEFDYPYPGVNVASEAYLDAATTNLFYMNNIFHDIFYQYGFDEQSGNFQMNNYGRGGRAGDFVYAEAQDQAGVAANDENRNNANFATPTDGFTPRMQMYIWTNSPPGDLTVNSPDTIAGGYKYRDNSFDPGHVPIPEMPLTQNVVLYQDPAGGTNLACAGPPLNAAAINGKIALIRRNGCNYSVKVKNAQDAGAIAVIVFNSAINGSGVEQDPDTIPFMGSDGTGVNVPAVTVSFNTGEAMVAALGRGETVNITLNRIEFVNSDGDFDNGIITHEYGHGVNFRLVGGPSTLCLNSPEQMGEGWADFYALMLQMKVGDNGTDKRGLGTFVNSEPTDGVGIRRYQYSTDMTINPFTFASTNGMHYKRKLASGTEVDVIDVHSVGSVWATMLWDLAWAYVDKYGFDPDKYNGTGGNNKVLQLVIDALKLQPCSPNFISGRDAIIQADQNTTGGEDFCLIWEVFARRGLGVNASSGDDVSPVPYNDVTGIQNQTEDFTTPPAGPNCALSVNNFNNEKCVKVYPNPSNGNLKVAILKYTGKIKFELYDINGRRVYSKSLDNFSIEQNLNLNSLQAGIYMLKAQGQNLSFTRKIILN